MRRLLKRYLPTPDALRKTPGLACFGNALFHPALWHLNRRSAPGAIAIGMFCGLIPGPFQMLGAALMCLALRKHVALAMLTTLYTNPATIVPLYLAAFGLGNFVLARNDPFTAPPDFHWQALEASLSAWADWCIGLGQPLALGLPLLALLLALAGYILTLLAWRCYLVREYRRRKVHKD